MNVSTFLEKLNQTPEQITFEESIAVIEENYNFSPTAFENGVQHNTKEQNLGSCKIFAFAEIHNLSVEATLACYGDYYREEVLKNPNGMDHQNIRNFIKSGWDGIAFYGSALELKA